ncbi:hypothetical protein HBF26_17155 [Luteibacter jiangsuensis]|uniref:Uncharacterized protein n=1 Tax=Luteibacter jiangsuensis TaxID=637577 RepID=A0ABX0Q8D1_9GAMM|nr:hypothetical protein [Luteibacter jiangsuensis]NID06626.1 hypothetical protein [Luteibacter jiangsuensis]
MKEHYELRKGLHHADADLTYSLDVFGDALAEKQGYKSDLHGLDAVRYYLMQKHHWLPRDVKAMSYEDLQFALSEEQAGWLLPKDAR